MIYCGSRMSSLLLFLEHVVEKFLMLRYLGLGTLGLGLGTLGLGTLGTQAATANPGLQAIVSWARHP